MEDRIGQQLGNYKILRQVGQGGFADVYLGEHIHLRTQAAIKVLQVRLGENNKQNFLNEARTIAHLVHPYIVRVLDFGIQDNTPFLVMDYAPNGTFRQRFLQGKPLPAAPLIPYIKQTAAALQYGHDKKLIHRDVKPENMLLSRNNEILLSDFGLALIAYNSTSRSPTETAGTAAYMAPEQLQGKPRPASDQYALGMIAYEWITGSCPFHGSFFEIASQQVLTQPPPMREKAPQTPVEVEKVIMRALEKDSQKRFPNVREFSLALEDACLTSRQYFFELPHSRTNPDGAPISSMNANSSSDTHDGTIGKQTGAPAERADKPFAKPGQSTTSQNHKYPAGLGQAPAAASQPERLRPAIQPTSYANLPIITPPQHSGGSNSSFSNMRPLPIPPAVSQVNFPVYTGPGPVSQPNLPTFPTERSPRSQIAHTTNIGQASPRTSQEGQASQAHRTPPGANTTPVTQPTVPLGARPISQVNPTLMAALQQSLPSGTHTTKNAQQASNSISGSNQAQVLGPAQQAFTDLHKRPDLPPNARDKQIEEKFAFKINRWNETSSRKPSQLLSGNMLIVAVIIIFIIAGVISISLLSSNNAAQQLAMQQTNATATGVSTQATATSAKAAEATQTAQANANPYVTNGTSSLVLDDPLTSNRNTWQEGADSTGVTAGTCSFTDQGYKIDAPALEPTMCFENKDTYSNFTYQVNMTFTSIGQSFSGAGIVFRGNVNTKEYYFFEVYASGNYSLQKCTVDAGCANPMDGYKLGKPALTAFKQGTNVTNTLAVVADGDTITLFVNKQKISAITDQISAPYSSGNIGVMATGGNDTGVDSTTNTPTNVVFSHAKIWSNS